jgi:hypothetical protein
MFKAAWPWRFRVLRGESTVPTDPGIWTIISGGAQSAPGLPGIDQDGDRIARWIKKDIKTDAVVVVRHTQRNLVEFNLDRVVNINFNLERLMLETHGTFRFDGTPVSGPRGALALLAPEADVSAAALGGQAWINGRPAYRRPLPPAELALAKRLIDSLPGVPAVA